MAFKKYDAITWGRGQKGNFPILSLWKGGNQIAFNSKAVKAFDLNVGRACNLYYDEETNRMAVQLLPEGTVSGLSLRKHGDSRILAISSFLKTLGFTVDRGARCEITKDKDTGFLVVSLDGKVSRLTES